MPCSPPSIAPDLRPRPFRLFNDLMATDWIAREVKRDSAGVCWRVRPRPEARGARRVPPASIDADPERMFRSRYWPELSRGGPAAMLPGLQRHAVRALAEDVGEPLRDVLAEFFLRPDRDPQAPTP